MFNNHRSAAQWRTIFSQQQNSGLSVTAFCGQHKLATSNFYTWRKKLNGTLLPVASGSSDWHAIEPMASSVGSGVPGNPVWDLEFTLPGGAVLRLHH
jgi:putative transposase